LKGIEMEYTFNGQELWRNIHEYKDDIQQGKAIALIWTTEDVHVKAEENDIELTEEQAIKVLEYISNHHDCSYGVNWDTIDCSIDEVLENWEG
jgi:hypothetical protein